MRTALAPMQIPNISMNYGMIMLIRVAHGRNTMFYLKDGNKIFVTKTLKYFADLLKPIDFLRIHQSHLVNSQYISAFIKTDGGYLLLKNGDNVPVSVRKKAEIIEVLDKMHR